MIPFGYMNVQRISFAVLAGGLSLALAAYIFADTVFTKFASGGLFAVANECVDPDSISARQNPHKMLFISCGGFLE